MKTQDIYHKMRAIAEDYHAYTDQLTAIAKWIEAEFDYNPQKLANGANTEQKALHIDSVSHRIDFEKLRQDYFNECVDKTNGKSKLYVCLAPHDLFEWFRKELLEYGG